MTTREIMEKINELLDKTRCAVLATVSGNGIPRLRWMSPLILPEQEGIIYAVSSSDFRKVTDIKENPLCTWMFQTKELNEIINLTGKINIIDNPSLKKEIIEKIGHRLHVFWKLKGDSSDFIILETVIENAVYFNPLKGEKLTVKFKAV